MEGAAKRAETRRAEVWMTAMLPHLKKPVSFEDFTGAEKPKRSKKRDWEAELAAWQSFAGSGAV